MTGLEIPLHDPGIETKSVGAPAGLKNHENWKRIHGIFKSAAQKSPAMRVRQDPAIAEPRGPQADAMRHASRIDEVVPAASPNFHLGAAHGETITVVRSRM